MRYCLVLFASLALCYGQTESLIPPSKLRPGDPARFFPNLVRLGDEDMAQLESLLVNELKRPDLVKHLQKNRLLPELPRDAGALATLLDAPSERLKEWTLRTLGETPGENATVTPLLVKLLSRPDSEREVRALAARVIGTTPLDTATAAALANALRSADKELQVILLEVLAKGGRPAASSLPALAEYLNAPHASVQFHAFRAIRGIEKASHRKVNEADPHLARAREIDGQRETREASAEGVRTSITVLKAPETPEYLACVALLHLSGATNSAPATEAILQRIGSHDEFVMVLAANVLNSFEQFVGESLEVLSRALSHTNANVRLQAALALKKAGPGAARAIDGIIAGVNRAASNGASPREIGACLDALRNIGTNAGRAAPAVMRLLEEQSPVYRNLSKHNIDHLRAFLHVTLAEIGMPREALPFVASSLASGDNWMTLEFAGAARAAGALGPAARELVPLLVRPLEEPMQQGLITFEKFDAHTSSTRQYTTAQTEALRALRQIGTAAESAAPAVRAFLQRPLPTFGDTNALFQAPDLRNEAAATLATIEKPPESNKR